MRDLAGRCSRRRSLHTPTTPNTTQPLPLLPLPPPPPPHPYAHHQIKITNSNLAGCRPDKGREKGEAGPTVQLTTTLCGAQSGTGRVLDSTPGLRLPTPASIVDHIVAVGHVQNTVRSQLSWLWLRILVLRQYEGRWRRHPPHMQLFRLRVSVSVRSTVLYCTASGTITLQRVAARAPSSRHNTVQDSPTYSVHYLQHSTGATAPPP